MGFGMARSLRLNSPKGLYPPERCGPFQTGCRPRNRTGFFVVMSHATYRLSCLLNSYAASRLR